MRVVFVGAGNLATRLSLEMRKSGMSIGQVYSHTSEHAGYSLSIGCLVCHCFLV